MFWSIYVELCNSVQKAPNKVAAELGITSGTATKWKNGAVPQDRTIKKIADYFGVTVEYLKGETDIKNPAAEDSSGIEKEALYLLNQLSAETQEEVMSFLRYKVAINQKNKKKEG